MNTSFRHLSALLTASLCCASLFGCAGSSHDTSSPADASQTAAPQTAPSASSSAASDSASPAKIADIPESCRTSIQQFIAKFDGKIEVITSAGSLYSLDADGNRTLIRDFGDKASEYVLFAMSSAFIHLHSDRIMLENSNLKELFKMQGDPANPMIAYSSDSSELVIRESSSRYNVWKTETGFGEIAPNERVQDFVNRQKPDHFLKFPGDVLALSLGKDGHVAIAMNDTANNKYGLLYHMDSVGAPGKLQVIGRTNSNVKSIAISPNADSIAAVDENGKLFVAGTDKKGFFGFSKEYDEVNGVLYHGSNPVIVAKDRLVVIDIEQGIPAYSIDRGYNSCLMAGDQIICENNGALDFIQADTGKITKRAGFASNDTSCLLNF